VVAVPGGSLYNPGVLIGHDCGSGSLVPVLVSSLARREQHKVDYSHKYIRTGQGIYRASRYPAAF
jgi:hypothetical protein